MKRIDSRIDTASEAFRRNHQAMSAMVANFRERMEVTRHQRPPHEIKCVRAQGKLLVRERLDLLLDPGTPFLEFGAGCLRGLQRRGTGRQRGHRSLAWSVAARC